MNGQASASQRWSTIAVCMLSSVGVKDCLAVALQA